ncbi:Hypothetical protein MBVG_2660 [Mycoplasmopsis bovigenitalium 51080]|uniref:SHOCT domain-containing protein n=1 Tax=Mycoplasmopsis bovigenitalium 51080 TaxID=1188235 RepID=N9V3C2_9BACT|nr:hypothetical protein [Mycoplasmopsis bovigenitalium]ENY69857.1 Hypothetical protein MBVG_2660 [Mycoplasmopsis bovigenitalium 51080]
MAGFISDTINKIGFGVFNVFWYLLVVMPLILIKSVLICYQLIAISLPQYLLFGIGLSEAFELSKFPTLFLRLLIISVAIYIVIFAASLIRLHFWKGDNEPNPVSVALKYSVLATVWIIGIPLVLYVFNLFIGIMINLITGTGKEALDYQIFINLYDPTRLKGISLKDWQYIYEHNYFLEFKQYVQLENGRAVELIFLGSLLSVSTLVPLVMGMLVVVQKVFQQFFLFIIAPFVAPTAMADDGKRLRQWGQMYFAKGFSILGFLVSIQVLGAFILQTFKWVNSPDLKDLHIMVRYLLILGVIVGGAVASTSISSEVAAFIGESASIKESISETKGMMAGAMALGGGVFAAAKGVGKLMKGGGGALAKAGAAVKGGKRGVQALNAKRDLKAKLKNGKIDKEEYKLAKQGLAAKVDERRESVLAAKNADREDLKNLKTQYKEGKISKEEYKEARKDLSLNTKQLTKKENALAKEEAQLLKKGNKEEAKAIAERRQKIGSLIDKKIERRSGDSLSLNKEQKSLLENAKRTTKKDATNQAIIDTYRRVKKGKDLY